MYLAVRAVSTLVAGEWRLWPSFLLLVATGAAVYLLYAALFMRPIIAEFRDLLRR
jgi:hypothetical protein